jgi:hypothetical protein
MSEAEELLELVGEIYDAALDHSLWPGVIERTCRFTNTACGALSSYDMLQRHLDVNVSWGYAPYYLDLLLERYVHLNPLMTFAIGSSVGDVLVATERLVASSPRWDSSAATATTTSTAAPATTTCSAKATMTRSTAKAATTR